MVMASAYINATLAKNPVYTAHAWFITPAGCPCVVLPAASSLYYFRLTMLQLMTMMLKTPMTRMMTRMTWRVECSFSPEDESDSFSE